MTGVPASALRGRPLQHQTDGGYNEVGLVDLNGVVGASRNDVRGLRTERDEF
jgi:hypothetical protein